MAGSSVPLPFVDVRGPARPAADAAPAVLIHGWASGSVYREPLASTLLDAGWPVWILDLPGYHPGELWPSGREWTLESAAASVAAAIAARTEVPVHLVGHSMGGSVSLTLAADRPALGTAPRMRRGVRRVLEIQRASTSVRCLTSLRP